MPTLSIVQMTIQMFIQTGGQFRKFSKNVNNRNQVSTFRA